MTFVKAPELVPQSIGLRSLSKLKSAHGGLYTGIHYDQSHFYLVLGTKDKPVTTPKGITVNDDPKGAWASLSISCDDNILPAINAIDDRMRELLAENSEPLFGMKCTPDMIAKYKFYSPLAYSKPDSVLPPLAGGKVMLNTIVENEHGHQLNTSKTDNSLAKLADMVPSGSRIRLVCSLSSLYFSAETKCKLSVKVERVQLLEAGTDVAEVADYSFDD